MGAVLAHGLPGTKAWKKSAGRFGVLGRRLYVCFSFSYSGLAGWLPRWSVDLFDTPSPFLVLDPFYFCHVSAQLG